MNEMKFEDMKVFNSAITDCCLPQVAYNAHNNQSNVISYCSSSPDARCSLLRGNFRENTTLLTYDLDIDNPLSAHIRLCKLDRNGRFGFIVNEIEDFAGKQLPAEANFVKVNCLVFDLPNNNRIIDKFSYVIRKGSRFEVQSSFLNQK